MRDIELRHVAGGYSELGGFGDEFHDPAAISAPLWSKNNSKGVGDSAIPAKDRIDDMPSLLHEVISTL